VVLATIFQHSPQILLASKLSGIEHVQNLIGKKIAMEANSADIIAYMNGEGVSLDSCIVNEHSFDANMLIGAEIDAITAYSTDEPFVLNKANFEYTILTPVMGGIDFYGDVLFATEEFIKNNPVIVDDFRKASLQGWKYAMENPDEIISLIYNKYTQRHTVEHLKFEADHMKNLVMADVVEMGYTNPGRWLAISNTYKKLNMLQASFTTKGLLYSDYIEPEIEIPWGVIAVLLIFIVIGGSVAYFFYNVSRKLKNEIETRHRIQKDLLDSEEKHRILFLNSPDAYLIIANGVFVECNHAAEFMLRGVKSQIVGQLPEVISPEFQPDGNRSSELAKHKIEEALTSGSVFFDWVHNRFDGTDLFVEVSLASMTLEGKPALLTTWRDITQRKQAEEGKRENEAIYRAILNASPDAITISDLEGKYIMVSPSAVSLAGLEREEDMTGRHLADFIIPEDRERALYAVECMLLGVKTGPNQYKGIRADGKEIDIEVNGSLIKDAFGKPALLVFSIRDISGRKRAEAEILLKNEELRKISSEKDKFFSIVAHDLRGPFNGFLGLTEIMSEDLPSLTMPEIQQIAKSMRNSATNLYRLLENLLYWTQNEQGLIHFNPEFLDLQAVVDESLIMVLELAKNKNIEIQYLIPTGIKVYADGNMFQTLIRNLASNAVKFTPKAGKVIILAEYINNGTEICIEDTGIGMDNEMVSRLFHLDGKISRKGTEGEPSSGLGLVICKDFVEKHGGKFWVNSEKGKGSKFCILLPLK
jgi:PAS domain S-box-containing protein